MSAATGAAATNLSRTFSIGPVKVQVFDIGLISGDTTAVCTGDRMKNVYWAFITGVTQTAVPSFSNGAATFTFSDPAATIKAQAILFGV